MQRANLRYVLIGLAVVLGMGLAGFAVASTFKEPGSSDLGPSIVFTPSPAASEPRKSVPDKGAEPGPEPTGPSAPQAGAGQDCGVVHAGAAGGVRRRLRR